jgi:hypothetical protein
LPKANKEYAENKFAEAESIEFQPKFSRNRLSVI